MKYYRIIAEGIGTYILGLAGIWALISAILMLDEVSKHEVAHIRIGQPYYVGFGILWLAICIIITFFRCISEGTEDDGDGDAS